MLRHVGPPGRLEAVEPLKTFFSSDSSSVSPLSWCGPIRNSRNAHSSATRAAASTHSNCSSGDRHIARAHGTHLPSSYPKAIEILLSSLGPELASDELIGVGMAPFFYLPHTLFVAEHGLKQSIASFPRPDSHASISEGWG